LEVSGERAASNYRITDFYICKGTAIPIHAMKAFGEVEEV
jgi:hypothetical protein